MTWTIDKAKRHYNIEQWSQGYFDINEKGHIVALPDLQPAHQIDLNDLVQSLMQQGLRLPILIRFADILKHRIAALQHVFSRAIAEYGYQGNYISVYPIKVNQQHYVAETIHQQPGVGLESGSKSELLAVLALAKAKLPTVIVCNGYKDQEYIRLALVAQQLGHDVYIIIEKLSELDVVLQVADELQVTPKLGLRVRLASIAKGNWQNTGGERSKFGLTAGQITACIDRLKSKKKLACLSLLHCHLGSQISNIRDIKSGLSECARFYSEIVKLGVCLTHIDVGGGLGVDYEGTSSRSVCSMNYSWREYANSVVLAFKAVCDREELEHPHIITESGRGLTAHHAMLVTNIIDTEYVDTSRKVVVSATSYEVLWHMRSALEKLTERNAIEIYHEMSSWLSEVHQAFQHNIASLNDRAQAECLYSQALERVRELLDPAVRHHREMIDRINEKLAVKLFCNLSVFQSLPDIWAINQIFPILPLSNLACAPTVRAVLQDITCDSDGRVDEYVDGQGIEKTLPLPGGDNLPEYLAFFMVGAYQEILGDMHNLFGDTDSVHIELDGQGGYQVTHQLFGNTSADVLRYVNFSEEVLLASFNDQIDASHLDQATKQYYLQLLEEGLRGYTYLENEGL